MGSEKLESIRRRIAIIRQALESPDLITTIEIDGIAEKVDRKQLNEELRDLEWQEAVLSGKSRRAKTIDMGDNW